MKTSSKKSKKNLLALALSFVMVASGASAFAACDKGNDGNDSSSDSTTKPSTSVNSDLKIANGDFETFNTNDGLTVIGTSTTSAPSWTRTSTASSLPSLAASGIVNVTEWDELITSKLSNPDDVKNLTVEQAKELFGEEDALTIKDKLAYYDAWKAANSKDKDKIATKLKDFYESFNIDSGDLPLKTDGTFLESPLTHDYDANATENKNNNVLMIHNQRPEAKPGEKSEKGTGTAQKYTSTTKVTVEAGTAATFSVWVKTADLQIANTEGYLQPADNAGAFINVLHTVGTKSLPALTIKNIDTKDVTENNGWKQYTFYLKGSAYTDTSFTIELGLGMGTTDQFEYVNGYAFFDDVECQTISYARYDNLTGTQATNAPDATVAYSTDADDKVFATNGDMSLDCYAIDLCHDLTPSDILDELTVDTNGFVNAKPTVSELGDGSKVTSIAGGVDLDGDGDVDEKDAKVANALGNGFSDDGDFYQIFDGVAPKDATTASGKKYLVDSIDSNSYLKGAYNKYFSYIDEEDTRKVYDFAQEDKILMLFSAHGVAYTLDTEDDFTFKFADYLDAQNNPYDYLAVSFFVKTSDMAGFTGAGVTLNDGTEKYSFTSIDTTDSVPVKVDLNQDGVEDEDVNDGWQQYFFFVENGYENKALGQFDLSFSFGPTDIASSTRTSFHEGFAAFTKFQVYPMSKAEYEAVAEGTYAKVVSVTGYEEEKATGNSGFDSAANVPSDALDQGFAKPMNYTGVYSNSQYVNQNGTNKDKNNYANAGLLNKDGFAKYFNPTVANSLSEFLMKATGTSTTDDAETVWNAMFGYTPVNRTQPLFIWNTETDENKATNGMLEYGYGFYGKNVSVSANSYKKISLAVKVGALNAADADKTFANVYLIDMDSKYNADVLSIGRNLTYWYDDEGNICADKDCEIIAFELQSNGLYQINKSWNAYKELVLSNPEEAKKYDGYFANLEAYDTDKDGNLVVADGGASHDYDSYWNNEGLDGIAFYAKKSTVNGAEVVTYYADKACTIPVNNLFNVTKTDTNADALLEARYLAEESKQLAYQIGNTNGEWVNVSFYIHTGAEAKNYRLEVWSGDRNGAGNPVNSYVAFDMNSTENAESDFTTYISQYEDDKNGYETNKNAVAFESVFSWYDSASYLRYNKSLDKNGYGNLYADSYTYSANESGIAYLSYEDSILGSKFVRILADYAFEDVTVTPATRNESTPDTSAPDEDEATGDETNFFMLFSSISIAAVLVFVIAAVAVRKILKKLGKLPKNPFARKAKKAKPAKTEATEAKPETKTAKPAETLDEDSPYND